MSLIITFIAFSLFVLLICVVVLALANSGFRKFQVKALGALNVLHLAFAQVHRRLAALEQQYEDDDGDEPRIQ